MTEDQFTQLMNKNISSLKTIFCRKRGILATADSISINHTAFKSELIIAISQNGVRTIEIGTAVPTSAQYLWEVLCDTLQLSMLFEGEFLKLELVEFYLDGKKTDWSDKLFRELESRMLSIYSSADFVEGNSEFVCPLNYLTDESMNKWIQIKDELQLIHPMVLYGMCDVKIPVELKTVFLIEAFEPLFELIQQYRPEIEKVPAVVKPGHEKDSNLRRILESTIQIYGTDIFMKEIEKDIYLFTQVLTNSRNRIFHIKANGKKLVLGETESILYAAKLSMLYRRILLDLLGVSYDYYSEHLKENVCRWNTWNGVLDFFLASKWNDLN